MRLLGYAVIAVGVFAVGCGNEQIGRSDIVLQFSRSKAMDCLAEPIEALVRSSFSENTDEISVSVLLEIEAEKLPVTYIDISRLAVAIDPYSVVIDGREIRVNGTEVTESALRERLQKFVKLAEMTENTAMVSLGFRQDASVYVYFNHLKMLAEAGVHHLLLEPESALTHGTEQDGGQNRPPGVKLKSQ